MRLLCLQAKFITFSGNMTKLCPSLWEQELLSMLKVVSMGQKNTLKLLSVRKTFKSNSILANIYIVAKAIDRYVELRSDPSPGVSNKIDPRLQHIIEGIFQRCIDEGEHKQVYIQLNSWSSPLANMLFSRPLE